MSEKKKDSNELLNIILIILGAIFVVQGILSVLIQYDVIDLALPPELTALNVIFGSQWLISVILGFWALVSGIGMFKEEEWAMGQALVVLSIMAAVGINGILSLIDSGGEWWTQWISYIPIVSTIVGILGFLWLLATRKRYD